MKRTNANDRLKQALRTILAAASLAAIGGAAEAQYGSYNVAPMGGMYGMGRLGGPLVVADFSGGAYGGGAYGGYVSPYAFPSNAGFGTTARTGFTGTFNTGVGAGIGTGFINNNQPINATLATGPNLGITDPLLGFRQPRTIVNPFAGVGIQQSAFPVGFPVNGVRVGPGNSLVDISNGFPAGSRHIFASTGAQAGFTQQSAFNAFNTAAVNGGIGGNTFVEQSNSFPPGTIHILSTGSNGSFNGGFNNAGNTFVEQSNSFPPGTIHILGSPGFGVNGAIRSGLNAGFQTGFIPATTRTTAGFGLATSLPRR